MSGNQTPELIRFEHLSDNIEAKRGALFGNDGTDWIRVKVDSTGRLVLSYVVTGAYVTSNVTPDRTFDPTTALLAEVAQVLGTLIEDLQAKGILEV